MVASELPSCILESRNFRNQAALLKANSGSPSRLSSGSIAGVCAQEQRQVNAASLVANKHSQESISIDVDTKPQIGNAKLPQIAKMTLARRFNPSGNTESIDQFAKRFTVPAPYKKRAGVFVTFSKNGKTRACWGSIFPRFDDLVKATVYTTEEALTNEYRYPKIREDEVQSLKAQVTVVNKVVPISSMSGQNPIKCGLMVRSGNRSGVILPGEAVDAHYQLVQCKLKAAIPMKEKCQLYRIVADVYI